MMQYRREIDGLRALAVLPVIFFHADINVAGVEVFSGGYVGVDIFFVISGYLITTIILSEMETGTFSFVGFYERRLRRIVPALSFVIFCCLPFAWMWMLPYQLIDFSESMAAVAAFSSNILFWQETGYFGPAIEQKPLLHTWSLAVEEQFYVVFPVFIVCCWTLGWRVILGLLCFVSIVSLCLAEWGWRNAPGANFYLAPTRAWELAMGSIVAFVLIYKSDVIQRIGRLPGQYISLVGILLILYSVFSFDSTTPFPSIYTILPTAGTGCIILFANGRDFVGRLLSTRLPVGIGLISYSAYLWHQPLFAFARIKGLHHSDSNLMLILILLTLVLAYFSWKFVERPFRSKRGFTRQQIFAGALFTSLLMIGLGLGGHFTKGFVNRFPPSDRYLASFNPTEQGRYVSREFDSLVLKPFDQSAKFKLFLVGDSYAQDFLNTGMENAFFDSVSVSTHIIGDDCGIVISKADYTLNIDEKERAKCEKKGRFESPEVVSLLKQADLVILSASWRLWQVEFLPETISNLLKLGARDVVVIGRKNFGSINHLDYIGMSDKEKQSSFNLVLGESRRVNVRMHQILNGGDFVNIQQMICGSDSVCRVFTNDLKLISHDGGHLTADGARFVGGLIFSHPALERFRHAKGDSQEKGPGDSTKPLG